jgi:hypothetical protein
MGYYGVFLGMQYKNTRDIALRLDTQDFSERETITFKVPLAIPYMEDKAYERANCEIEHNGEFFRLVKQKYENDTLYIVCIKNTERKEIKKALADYVYSFTDKPVEPGGQTKTIPSFIKDYLPTEFRLESSVAGWSNALSFEHFAESTASLYLPIHSPPPRI